MLLDLAFDDISVDTISLVNKENIEVDVLRLDKLSPNPSPVLTPEVTP